MSQAQRDELIPWEPWTVAVPTIEIEAAYGGIQLNPYAFWRVVQPMMQIVAELQRILYYE